MSEPLLRRDRDDRGVVTLTLNRPQAFNALSEAMLTELGRPSPPSPTMRRYGSSYWGHPARLSAPATT